MFRRVARRKSLLLKKHGSITEICKKASKQITLWWTDEAKVELFGLNAQRFAENKTPQNPLLSGGGLMVWACSAAKRIWAHHSHWVDYKLLWIPAFFLGKCKVSRPRGAWSKLGGATGQGLKANTYRNGWNLSPDPDINKTGLLWQNLHRREHPKTSFQNSWKWVKIPLQW